MADWGLLQGIAEGLKGGIDAYQTARKNTVAQEKLAEEIALKKRAQKIQEAKSAAEVFDVMGTLPRGVFDENISKAMIPKEQYDKFNQTGLVEKPSDGLLPTGMIKKPVEVREVPDTEAQQDDGTFGRVPGFQTKKEREQQRQRDQIRATLAAQEKMPVWDEKTGAMTIIPMTDPEKQRQRDLKYQLEQADIKKREQELIKGGTPEQIEAARALEMQKKQLELERIRQEMKIKDKKAAAGPGLPKEVQKQVNDHLTSIGKMKPIQFQLNEVVRQLRDPKISHGDKVALAGEQVKLLNSSLGADAVGAEEVKRVAAFLNPMPNPFIGKYKIGPDLEAATKQFERSHERVRGAVGSLQRDIEVLKGKAPADSVEMPIAPKPVLTDQKKAVLVQSIATLPKTDPRRAKAIEILKANDPTFKGE